MELEKRLEEIKVKNENKYPLGDEKERGISQEDVDWLIEQNELLKADKDLLQSKWEAQGMMIQKMHEEEKGLNYNELYQFMQEFGVDFLNMYGEMIIDNKTNTYTHITGCNDLDDVKTRVIYVMCRPIGKGLEKRDAFRLLKRVNDYFKTQLTKDDMLLMYQDLCYEHKLDFFKDFIKRGFPIDELKGEKENV